MEVESLLKEQVNLLKASFTDDVISAILKENPEFKKYMDFQERSKKTVSDVTSEVNLEINKERNEETLNLNKSEIPIDLKKSEIPIDLKKSEIPIDLKKSESPIDLKTSEIPIDLNTSEIPIDLKKSESPIDLKKSEMPKNLKKSAIPTNLNGITIEKINKNVEYPSDDAKNVNKPPQSDFNSKMKNKDKISHKETVTITKSEKTKKFLTKRCWYDGNEYECPSCNLVLFQYSSFKPHLQKLHQLTPAKINELCAKAKTLHDSQKYKCNICKMYIFYDKKDIMTHLEKIHKMSLKIYEEGYPQHQEMNSVNKGKAKENANIAHLARKGIIITKTKTKEGINESLHAEKSEGIQFPKTDKIGVDGQRVKNNNSKEDHKSENCGPKPKLNEDEYKNDNLQESEHNIKDDQEPNNQGTSQKLNEDKYIKESENVGTKRKLHEDIIVDEENKLVHTNKKSKFESIKKCIPGEQDLLKENQTDIKTEVLKNSKDSLKKCDTPVGKNYIHSEKDTLKAKGEQKNNIGGTNPNKKEITYTVALVQNCSGGIKSKEPKREEKSSKENTTKNNSTKKPTLKDPKEKTTQKHFQKYGQQYKESISYSEINNDPYLQTSRCWYDGIQYQCSFCNNIFFEIVNFRSHIKKSHELPTEVINEICIDAKKTHDNSEYECLICQALIVFEKNDIRIHLKVKHSLSLKQYEEIDITDQSKIVALSEVNKSNSSVEKTAIKKKWFEERAIPCHYCKNEYLKVDSFIQHIAEAHSEKKDKTTKKSFQTLQQYKCKVQSCSSRIKRHQKNIGDHLKKMHSLTLQDYEKIHENIIEDMKTPSVALEVNEQSLESNEQPIPEGDGQNDFYDNEEYEYQNSYDFDEDFFAKKYFCPLESCDQIMYQEDIESGRAMDHFKFDHYLTVEDIADNLAHLEDIVMDNDESVERINYSCPIKECNFVIHQTMANSSALAMHLGFQHQMSYHEVLLNLFYFANLVKREVAKVNDEEELEEKEEDYNKNIILRKSVVDRTIYMRGCQISRKERVFDCRVCKSDPMSEGAADLHLTIHHALTPQEIKINLGVIVL